MTHGPLDAFIQPEIKRICLRDIGLRPFASLPLIKAEAVQFRFYFFRASEQLGFINLVSGPFFLSQLAQLSVFQVP